MGWTRTYPAAGLFHVTVGGLSAVEMMMWTLQAGGLEKCQQMLADSNIKVLPAFFTTPEIFLNTTKELNTAADIKGLKIRTMGDDGAMFAEMGAAVVSMPGGEVYEAMQRGVIDSFQFSTPATDLSVGLNEVCDYVYISGVRQAMDFHYYTIDKNKWAKLPDDIKAIVREACLAEAWKYYSQLATLDVDAIQAYQDYGVTVEKAPQALIDELLRQAEIFYADKAAEDPFYAEVYNSQMDYMKGLRQTFVRY
jgi:TRAP-type mannitol/chloroaromatic compound transport system substrate-binding protein